MLDVLKKLTFIDNEAYIMRMDYITYTNPEMVQYQLQTWLMLL
jgi:hypothetical protein